MTNVGNGSRPALQSSELFTGLLPDELAKVQAIAKRRDLKAGERIFRFGEPADTLYIVESGTVGLTLPLTIRGSEQDVTVDEKGPGAVVAWSALVPPNKFTLGALTKAQSVLIGIDRALLVQLLESCPRIKLVVMSNLAHVIAGRVVQLEGILLRDMQRWVSER